MNTGHGTWNCYNNHACRCQPCTDAARRYRKRLQVERLSGREPVIDADAARRHLLRAQEAGLSIRTLAGMSGLSTSTLQEIRSGRRTRTGNTVAARILAVKIVPDMRSEVEVPATGSVRRLRALATLGWGAKAIAAHSDASEETIDAVRRGMATVHARTHQRIADTYRRLITMSPPASNQRERAAATYTRRWAARKGWVGPMAWDDIDNDAAPVDVEAYKPASRPQQALELAELGLEDVQIATRLGVTTYTVRDYLSRRAAA